MEQVTQLFQMLLNLDTTLQSAAVQFGPAVYAILFLVIFCETGLVIFPFLPGDSLLVTSGVLAGAGTLNVYVLWTVCVFAAIIGDSVNYVIGRTAGAGMVKSGRFVKRSWVDSTQAFFEKHGGKTITIARFFVIVRTIAPFMAGVGKMNYARFVAFSVFGTLIWVTLFVGAGYLFGNIPWVKDNLEIAVLIVLFLSLIPGFYHLIQQRLKPKSDVAEDSSAETAAE